MASSAVLDWLKGTSHSVSLKTMSGNSRIREQNSRLIPWIKGSPWSGLFRVLGSDFVTANQLARNSLPKVLKLLLLVLSLTMILVGHIWGLIIQRKDKQWQVKLYALEPSRVSGIVRGTFNACARKKKITLLTFSQRFIISPSEIHTCEMNDALSQASTSSWRWTERTAWDEWASLFFTKDSLMLRLYSYRCMDPKDGSCYLEFTFRLLLAPISHN